MIAGLIVGGSVLFAVVLLAASLAWPGVRVRLEAPKHRFQRRLRDYDRHPSYPDPGPDPHPDPDGGRPA